MEANELRIGNLVSTPDEQYHKWEFSHHDFDYYRMEEITPIPLTEEWLLKFGFAKDEQTLDLFGNYDSWIERNGMELYLKSETMQKKIEYVHQLQNLYFALTGNELEIK